MCAKTFLQQLSEGYRRHMWWQLRVRNRSCSIFRIIFNYHSKIDYKFASVCKHTTIFLHNKFNCAWLDSICYYLAPLIEISLRVSTHKDQSFCLLDMYHSPCSVNCFLLPETSQGNDLGTSLTQKTHQEFIQLSFLIVWTYMEDINFTMNWTGPHIHPMFLLVYAPDFAWLSHETWKWIKNNSATSQEAEFYVVIF